MLDINLLRTNPEVVKENIKKKFQNQKLELVDKVSHFLLLLLTFSVIGILYINIVFFAYMQFIRTNYENEQRRQNNSCNLSSPITSK